MNVPPFHVLQLKKSCRFVRCRFDSGFGDLVKKFSSSVNGIAMCAAICNEAAIESHATTMEFAISELWITISKPPSDWSGNEMTCLFEIRFPFVLSNLSRMLDSERPRPRLRRFWNAQVKFDVFYIFAICLFHCFLRMSIPEVETHLSFKVYQLWTCQAAASLCTGNAFQWCHALSLSQTSKMLLWFSSFEVFTSTEAMEYSNHEQDIIRQSFSEGLNRLCAESPWVKFRPEQILFVFVEYWWGVC